MLPDRIFFTIVVASVSVVSIATLTFYVSFPGPDDAPNDYQIPADHIASLDDYNATFYDSVGFTIEPAVQVPQEIKSFCDAQCTSVYRTVDQLYWCAEYIGYLKDSDGAIVDFADITGHTPDWVRGQHQTKIICELQRSQDLHSVSDRHWCAEYAGYLKDAGARRVSFADSDGHTPDWAEDIGVHQTEAICVNRHEALADRQPADRYWCAQYVNHLRYGDEAFDGFADITGYTPAWAAQGSANQVMATCDDRGELLGDDLRDHYWCDEYMGYLQYGQCRWCDRIGFGSLSEYLGVPTPDWVGQKSPLHVRAICNLNPFDVQHCDVHDRNAICIHDDGVVFDRDDSRWCVAYSMSLEAGYLRGAYNEPQGPIIIESRLPSAGLICDIIEGTGQAPPAGTYFR